MTELQQTQLARAIEIAKEKGHKVFCATHRASGTTVYTVRSASDKNLYHVLFIQDGRIHCDCYCSQQGRICSHAAAVRLFLIAQRATLASVEAEEAAGSSCSTVEAEISRVQEDQAMDLRADVVDRKVEWTAEVIASTDINYAGDAERAEFERMMEDERDTCSLCGGMLVGGTCREGICARYGQQQERGLPHDYVFKLTFGEAFAGHNRETALPAQATDDQPFSLYKSE